MRALFAGRDRSSRESLLPPGASEIDSGLLRWRERALSTFLRVALAVSVAPLLFVFLAAPQFAPMKFRLFSLGVFVLLAGLAFAGRMPHAWRTWAFLLAGYGVAGMMLAATGLQGGGRLFLLGLPLNALVFLGPRPGWVASGIGLAVYAGMASLHARGLIRFAPTDGGWTYWLFQGVTLLIVLGPVMILLNRFIALLHRSLAAESQAAAQIEEEARERHRLERVLLETGERERRAVGHQLHDGPCQQITAALLRCKVAENTLAARSPEESLGHIRAIAGLLDASVGEIHDLARGLSPPELAPGALAAALDDLARRASAPGSPACDFKCSGTVHPGTPIAARQLFHIAQEAVNNAVRHSHAQRIQVELLRNEGALQLSVRDDGIGIAARDAQEGMGLRIMRHRAELIGGSLSVGPAPGGGTLVACTIPARSVGPGVTA